MENFVAMLALGYIGGLMLWAWIENKKGEE